MEEGEGMEEKLEVRWRDDVNGEKINVEEKKKIENMRSKE